MNPAPPAKGSQARKQRLAALEVVFPFSLKMAADGGAAAAAAAAGAGIGAGSPASPQVLSMEEARAGQSP